MESRSGMLRSLARTALALVALAAAAVQAEPAKRWTIVSLGTLSERGSFAVTVNNRGDIGGSARLPGGLFGVVSHAVIWRNGQMQDLGASFGSPPGSAFSQVDAVNEAGTFVINGPQGLMTLKDGVFTTLGLVAAAKDINSRGDIVGAYAAPGSISSPFLLHDGVLQDLGTLGGRFGQANAINDDGTIVGFSSLDANGLQQRPFVFKDGVMKNLGTFGGQIGKAIDVNNEGVVVGNAQDSTGRFIAFMTDEAGALRPFLDLPGNQFAAAINQHGAIVGNSGLESFLFEDGEITVLDDIPAVKADWFFLAPADINDRGWIVGTGNRRGGSFEGEAFLLIPQ